MTIKANKDVGRDIISQKKDEDVQKKIISII